MKNNRPGKKKRGMLKGWWKKSEEILFHRKKPALQAKGKVSGRGGGGQGAEGSTVENSVRD